jgi:K+-transporting ATPase ATPase A chain
MNNTLLFILQALTLIVILGLVYRPLGNYMAHVYTTDKILKAERGFYRLIGVDPTSEQSWPVYLRSLLAFSLIGILFVYILQRVQEWLPLSLGLPAVPEGLAWNTAISFVTNTNWHPGHGWRARPVQGARIQGHSPGCSA